MIRTSRDLILRELSEGTGAAFVAAEEKNGLRQGLRIWFADLDDRHGPVAEIRHYGLKGYQVSLSFGKFSGGIIHQINQAEPEDLQLARALIASIGGATTIEIPGQTLGDWTVVDGNFKIKATIRDQPQPDKDASLIMMCREVIVPIMAAMAELIGYDVIEEQVAIDESAFEGAVLKSVAKRRERNPRNRLLCIRIHGEKCLVCGFEPKLQYGPAGSIIEVHHLEPLALLLEPRPYDPRLDLVPLCPNCHRAVHTRRPIPLSLEELIAMREACNA